MALNYPTPNFSLNFSVKQSIGNKIALPSGTKHCELYELVLCECFPLLPASNRLVCMYKVSVNHSTPCGKSQALEKSKVKPRKLPPTNDSFTLHLL